MKNWEFYEEKLMKYGYSFAITVKDNQMCWCSSITCSECAFNTNEKSCNKVKVKWLYQKHEDLVILNDDEKYCVNCLVEGGLQEIKMVIYGGMKINRKKNLMPLGLLLTAQYLWE